MNLLRLFEFYLMAMFVIGTVRRFGLYHSVASLVVALHKRYRKLLGKVKDQSSTLLTWSMVAPATLTMVLWLMQSILTRVAFPHAHLTPSDLTAQWWYAPAVILPAILVLAIDFYFLIRVAAIDTIETEKYFSQAEWWIGSWKATAVKVVTFGYVDPHKMVDEEVKKAMASGQKLIHSSLWWTAVQTGSRVLLGFALWLVWTIGA